MKKVHLNRGKLGLNKQTVTSLHPAQMQHVLGGALGDGSTDGNGDNPDTAFTYSISWGTRCQYSRSLWANNIHECRKLAEYDR